MIGKQPFKVYRNIHTLCDAPIIYEYKKNQSESEYLIRIYVN